MELLLKKEHVIYYDLLNILAAFGVVAMHFNGLTHAYSHTWAWRQAFAVDCIFYWAVPVFFMLTGATLMDYREKYDTKTFFKKRFSKTLIPFIAWSLIALVWKVATKQMEAPIRPRSLINLIINTQIIDVYWFFIPLFAVYLCIPVLSLLRKNQQALLYMTFAAITFNVVLPFFASLVGINWNSSLSFSLLSGYLVYPVLGYLLSQNELGKKQRLLIYAGGVIGTCWRYIATVFASDAAGELVRQGWGYVGLPCLLEAVAVFVFFKHLKLRSLANSPRAQSLVSKVASCSFGVYLLHMIVFWYGLQLTGLNGESIIWRTLGPVVAYLICLAITLIAKPIPFVKALLP